MFGNRIETMPHGGHFHGFAVDESGVAVLDTGCTAAHRTKESAAESALAGWWALEDADEIVTSNIIREDCPMETADEAYARGYAEGARSKIDLALPMGLAPVSNPQREAYFHGLQDARGTAAGPFGYLNDDYERGN